MMDIPIEEIEENIQSMGYVTAKPQSLPIPSYYKLGDGTIISVLIRINQISQDPDDRKRTLVKFSTDVRIFTDPKDRNPAGKQPSPQNPVPSIIDDDMECIRLREDFNRYDLSDGQVMSVKAVVFQVQKTDMHDSNGEPIYRVHSTRIVKFTEK